MKQVSIIYNDSTQDAKLAERVADGLKADIGNSDYAVSLRKISSSGDMESFLSETSSDNCQVVIDINMTGYEVETTGGFASINRLPMNIVNVISEPVARFDEALKKNQSYMSWFVFLKNEEFLKAKEMYKHLWHVECVSGIEDMVSFIENMELRYR